MGVAQGRELVDDHDEAGEVGGGHVALSGTGEDALAVTDLGAEAVNGAAGAASVEIGDDPGDVRETRERFERGAALEIREQEGHVRGRVARAQLGRASCRESVCPYV